MRLAPPQARRCGPRPLAAGLGRMAAMTGAALIVPARFNGPPGSANGGYFSGRLAAYLLAVSGGNPPPAAITVTLRKPPPLQEPMDLVWAEAPGTLVAKIGTVVVAEAEPFSGGFDEVEPVSFEEARKAAEYYGGLVEHPFPACFSCGIARPAPDGLGLRPGLLPGREGVTAASWRPDGSLADAAGPARIRVDGAGLPGRLDGRCGWPAAGARPDERAGARGTWSR